MSYQGIKSCSAQVFHGFGSVQEEVCSSPVCDNYGEVSLRTGRCKDDDDCNRNYIAWALRNGYAKRLNNGTLVLMDQPIFRV